MIVYHTGLRFTASVKVAITIEQKTLARVDSLVSQRMFPNRSPAIQIALQEKLERQEGARLAAECANLDPVYEQAMAEQGFGTDMASWPEFTQIRTLSVARIGKRLASIFPMDVAKVIDGLFEILGA